MDAEVDREGFLRQSKRLPVSAQIAPEGPLQVALHGEAT